MRRVRAFFQPRGSSGGHYLPPDGDLNMVHVVGGGGGPGGPGGPGGAAVRARPPGDVLADGQDPHGEPQVNYLDSSWFSDV
jgi:hypothetical protein